MTTNAKSTSASASAPAPDAILQLGLAFWGSKALLTAVRMGLFTELAAGAMDLPQLSRRFDLHARSARDFLDALVALGTLQREDDPAKGARYSNTSATDLFLDRAKPTYVGGILKMADARLYPFWGALGEALRSGKPQNESKSGRTWGRK